ncbi:MAG: DUF1573 domain-containing protein [Saprospiraceae bacterium]|nr:DUF1573 domain-containing protein [Saprospiraceae bacterium]
MQPLKKITFSILMLFTFTAVFAQKATTPAKAKPAVQMTFDKETIALGKMKKGDKKTFDYVFTNTGTETIEIEIVSGCDCTTLDWTRKPIKVGEKGVVNVIFDSKEKDMHETSVDVDIYLKNKDKKTNSQILKIVNYTFELTK